MNKLLLTTIFSLFGFAAIAQTSNYGLPYRTQTRMLQILQVQPNTVSDSVLVRNSLGWVSSAPFPNWTRLDGKPSVFPTNIASVSGLQTVLDGKQPTGDYLTTSYTPNWSSISGKPLFSTVALTGNYSDLSGLPTIPTNTNQLTNGAGFLTSFTETDPTVPSYSKTLSGFSIIKASTDLLYKPIGYAPTSGEIASALGYTPYNGATNPNGYTTLSDITWSNVLNKPIFSTVATSGSYNDLIDKPTTIPTTTQVNSWNAKQEQIIAGTGIVRTGNTISVNTSDIMTVSNANSSIASLNSEINGKVPNARTITINGVTQDLSNNRTWTIDKSSVGLGNVDNTSDANKPISTATQTAITNGLATKQNTLSLTTTGTGAASLVGSTLNIPTPVINTYTAGAGIGITSNVITNTAPDQVVTLTAGNRISITGTYPNFTIGYIEPIINQVTRSVNTNYTIGTRQATVFYSIPVTATNPLLVGTSVGTAFLEYSVNSGTSWTTALSTSASSSVGLSVTIQLTTGGSNLLSGNIPANALVRIRTTTNGTATVGNAVGQETY